MDSNHGPRPYQGRALTKLSYTPIFLIEIGIRERINGRAWTRTMDLVLIRDAL